MPKQKPDIVRVVTSEVYVGVDPGASGGIAVVDLGGGLLLHNIPEDEHDVWDFFSDLKREFPNAFVCMEKVGGYVAGKGHPGSAMFNFGAGYGGLRMALVGNGLKREFVTPQVWQRALGIQRKGKGEKPAEHKRKLKMRACELYPGYKLTLKTCDAVLLATYIQRKRTGTL